jgi:integrase/recombinase XerD
MSKKKKAPEGCFWRGDIIWGRKKIDGIDHRKSLDTTDPKTASERHENWVKDLIADTKWGDNAKPCWLVRKQWNTQWPTLNARCGVRTMKRYNVSLNQMDEILGTEDDAKAGKTVVNIHQLKDVIGEIVDVRLEEDGITTRTLKNDLGALSSLCDFAEIKKWLDENPVQMILRKIKVPAQRIVPPLQRDYDIIRARAPQGMAWAMDGAKATGCRLGELVKSTSDHVDRNRQQLTVTGKRGKTRTIDISVYDGLYIFTKVPAYVGSKVLFWHGEGKAYRNFASHFCRLQWSIFCEYYDAAHGTNDATRPSRLSLLNYENEPDRPGWVDIGFRRFRFHDLRHLHAVQWLKDGRSIYDLRDRLGHTSVKTTEIYTSPNTGLLTADEVRRCMHERPALVAVA